MFRLVDPILVAVFSHGPFFPHFSTWRNIALSLVIGVRYAMFHLFRPGNGGWRRNKSFAPLANAQTTEPPCPKSGQHFG